MASTHCLLLPPYLAILHKTLAKGFTSMQGCAPDFHR